MTFSMRSRSVAAGDAVQMTLGAQVLADRQSFIQALGLEHDADACAARPADSLATSQPATSARPSEGTIMVERIRKRVDLPPPFGPSRPKISPWFTLKLTFESATRDP